MYNWALVTVCILNLSTKEAIRLGQQKVYGDVRFVQTNFGFSIGDPNTMAVENALAGGGPLMDVGIYCVQASRYVTGEEPLWVTAQFGPVTDKERFKDVEESVSWQMQFPGNAMVNGFTSYKSNIEQLYVSAKQRLVPVGTRIWLWPLKRKNERRRNEPAGGTSSDSHAEWDL
jgi:predicted dehydrogenase